MSRRLLTAFVVVLTCGATTAFVSAQKNAVPQTPWGEPDLQGTWTNQTLTPLERPANMADKPFYTKDEAAAAEKRAAEQRQSERRCAAPSGRRRHLQSVLGGTRHQVVGSLATSLVVDPADGRVPLQRSAEQRRDDYLEHESDSFDFMSPWDRCITRGIPGAFFPAGYNNAYQIVQSRGYVVIHYEMIHAARIIPTDGRSHLPRRPILGRRFGRSLGRQHARRRHHELQRQGMDRHQRRGRPHQRDPAERRPSRRRTLHAERRQHRLQVTIDDPKVLHEAVDGRDSAGSRRQLSDVRIRVSRGEQSRGRYPARRPSRGEAKRGNVSPLARWNGGKPFLAGLIWTPRMLSAIDTIR